MPFFLYILFFVYIYVFWTESWTALYWFYRTITASLTSPFSDEARRVVLFGNDPNDFEDEGYASDVSVATAETDVTLSSETRAIGDDAALDVELWRQISCVAGLSDRWDGTYTKQAVVDLIETINGEQLDPVIVCAYLRKAGTISSVRTKDYELWAAVHTS